MHSQTPGERSAKPQAVFAALMLPLVPCALALPTRTEQPERSAQRDPGTSAEQDSSAAARQKDLSENLAKFIWIAAQVYGTLREYITSGVESVSAFLLEWRYHVEPSKVGLLTSFPVYAAIPVIVFFYVSSQWQGANQLIYEVGVMRRAALAVVFASWLLSASIVRVLGIPEEKGAMLILTADSILYSAGFMSSAILDGFAFASCDQRKWYNFENFQLADNFLRNLLARTTGPAIVRYVVHAYGQDYYAGIQSTFSFLGFCMCVYVSINYNRPVKTKDHAAS